MKRVKGYADGKVELTFEMTREEAERLANIMLREFREPCSG